MLSLLGLAAWAYLLRTGLDVSTLDPIDSFTAGSAIDYNKVNNGLWNAPSFTLLFLIFFLCPYVSYR